MVTLLSKMNTARKELAANGFRVYSGSSLYKRKSTHWFSQKQTVTQKA